MFTNVNQIKILSRKPLWYIDEEGKIGYIQNVYSDAEQIQVIKDDHITNYPICKNLTVIQELNTVLFETEEDTDKAMLKEMDKCMLYYKYKECAQAFTLIDEKIVRNKQVVYRNEWTVVTLVNE